MTALRSLVDRYLDVFNGGDLEAWSELLGEDVEIRADSGTMHGREAAKSFAATTMRAFPGLRAELDRVVAESEDTIVVEYRVVNPDRGATAWRLDGTVCGIYEVREGLIASVHSYYLARATDRTDAARVPSRIEAAEIAHEQAALRRVATLVARGVSRDELFGAVCEEVARLVGADFGSLLRFEAEDTLTLVAAWSAEETSLPPVGDRQPLNAEMLALRDGGAPARFAPDLPQAGPFVAEARGLGIHSALGVPITVDGRVWGVSFVASKGLEPFPENTEARIAAFTELVATAIANAQARTQLRSLIEEQTALRRVATLVAGGASPAALFDAVAGQASWVLGGESIALLRYEDEGPATIVAVRGGPATLGMRVPIEGDGLAATVLRTGRPTRIDDYADLHGPAAVLARQIGMSAAVGAPIVVAGRLWGLIEGMSAEGPLPPGTEDRLAQFAELVATAIGNTESRAELTASRARVIAAADESRRRIQRDLHDGAQQRLVHTIITLKLAQAAVAGTGGPLADLVAQSLENAERATAELRELVQGIIPAALGHGGLVAGVESLLDQIDLPVTIDIAPERLPTAVETTAYFVVAEALTNAVKHSGATIAQVRAAVDDGVLELEVRDDGAGGADPALGTGLVGLRDRLAIGGGTLALTSPAGAGTTVTARVPIPARARLEESLTTR